jgi:hypothetical protein
MSSIKLAPVVPGKHRSSLVVDSPDHSLPFGIFFEEYAARRGAALEKYGREAFGIGPNSVWLDELRLKLTMRNDKYCALEQLRVCSYALPSQIEELEKDCRDADRPFNRVLHKMDSTAVCLSGGGIRSASFGLGVLEALARFSVGLMDPAQTLKRSTVSRPPGLLHTLDYLSTVSGGGYIGSWLTAWVYRGRTAEIEGAETELVARTAERKLAASALEKATAKATARSPVDATIAAASRSVAAQSAAPQRDEVNTARERLDETDVACAKAQARVDQAKAVNWESSYSR